MVITPLSLSNLNQPAMQNKRVELQISCEPQPPEQVVKQIAEMEGPVDIYCWYEGSLYLPKEGALFMKEQIFRPLHQLKPDAKLCLYSLKAWDFQQNVTHIATSTPLGEAIRRIHSVALKCIYSASFFQYCTQIPKTSPLYAFINEELPKKEWLFRLSDTHRKTGTTISALFNDQPSLFDCIKDLDVSGAYSAMQYVEIYYLIQESVRTALSKGQKNIQVAFVLPNDEGKYYRDLSKDIETMLELDFGKALADVQVSISLHFFRYGDSLHSRPYIDKRKKVEKVEPEEIRTYFDYLLPPSLSEKPSSTLFLRDLIHNINGWG